MYCKAFALNIYDKRMNEDCFLNHYTAGKTAGFATGCVFCSVRAFMIRHSRKLALRLKHFARWRKLAQTSLRKPRHYRPACSFCLRNAILRFLFTIKAFMRLSWVNARNCCSNLEKMIYWIAQKRMPPAFMPAAEIFLEGFKESPEKFRNDREKRKTNGNS